MAAAEGATVPQSEANNTAFASYVRSQVQPFMLGLKKVIDPTVG